MIDVLSHYPFKSKMKKIIEVPSSEKGIRGPAGIHAGVCSIIKSYFDRDYREYRGYREGGGTQFIRCRLF
jgi:hypothetical protein